MTEDEEVMDEVDTPPATEDMTEDWAMEAEASATRARMYAELSKGHAAVADRLNVQARRLLRTIIATLLVLTALQVLSLAIFWLR